MPLVNRVIYSIERLLMETIQSRLRSIMKM